jgi:hypothetical protein
VEHSTAAAEGLHLLSTLPPSHATAKPMQTLDCCSAPTGQATLPWRTHWQPAHLSPSKAGCWSHQHSHHKALRPPMMAASRSPCPCPPVSLWSVCTPRKAV